MSRTELTNEIQKVLNDIPEDALHDLLLFLKKLQSKPAPTLHLTDNLRQIISEDRQLLEKLAK